MPSPDGFCRAYVDRGSVAQGIGSPDGERNMAKKATVKFDRAGLASLGAEKLADILLDEAQANKALKLRLQAALAGAGGSDKIIARIDKRLDQIERSASRITANRARELAAELGGLVRTISGELRDDPVAAAERMVRMMAVLLGIMRRLYDRSAKIEKLGEEIDTATVSMIAALTPAHQVRLVPVLDKVRGQDRYGELGDIFSRLIPVLEPDAANEWRQLLERGLGKDKDQVRVLNLLQALAMKRKDFDEAMRLEELKPELHQDSFGLAQYLFEAGRFEPALEWVRRRPKGMRVVDVNGVRGAVGPEFGMGERKLLEADILERLKRRDDAQALRWREFVETFEPAVLRTYISKLDDFAEFEEMDKAFNLVMGDKDIHKALWFLIHWPKLDLAAKLVVDNARNWDGRHYKILSEAAELLADEQVAAAIVLYRALVDDILRRGVSEAYLAAASYIASMDYLTEQSGGSISRAEHEDYMRKLRTRHGKKYSFWSLVPNDLR